MYDEFGITCRGCFCNQKELLQSFSDNPILLELYVGCTNLQAELDDGLPMNLCTSCVEKCTSWHLFQQLCAQNDAILRKIKLDLSMKINYRNSDNLINVPINPDIEQHNIPIAAYITNEIKNEELDLDIRENDDESIINIDDESIVNMENALSTTTILASTKYNQGFLLANELDVINEIIIEELNISNENVATKEINVDSPQYTLNINQSSDNAGTSCDTNQKKDNNLKLENHQSTMSFDNQGTEFTDCGSKFKNNSDIKENITQFHQYVSNINQSFDNAGPSCDTNQNKETNLKLENPQPTMRFDNQVIECTDCGYKFENKLEIQKHITQFHNYCKRYNCKECGKKCTTQSDLLAHMEVHNNEKPYKCALCDTILINHEYFINHITKIHDNDIFLHCTFCKKRFLFKIKLNIHLSHHTGEKPFECALCNFTFIKHVELKEHVNNHHLNETLVQCSKCEKQFFCKNKLSEHLRRHIGEKPFKCSFCDKSFVNKLNLVEHVRKHIGAKIFLCHLCKQSFSRKGYFDRHMNNHKSKKKFKCTQCEKCFLNKFALANHTQRHTVKHKYQCTICENSFKLKNYLTKHMRRHTNEKPFVCTVCGKSFAMNEYLVKHMRRKHVPNH